MNWATIFLIFLWNGGAGQGRQQNETISVDFLKLNHFNITAGVTR